MFSSAPSNLLPMPVKTCISRHTACLTCGDDCLGNYLFRVCRTVAGTLGGPQIAAAFRAEMLIPIESGSYQVAVFTVR